MNPLSFVMECAPLGSLKKILTEYREAKCSLCPESVLLSIHQVSVYIVLCEAAKLTDKSISQVIERVYFDPWSLFPKQEILLSLPSCKIGP